MRNRYRRALWVLLALCALAIAGGLVVKAFRSNLVFFFTPTQLMEGEVSSKASRMIRVGGLVLPGSVKPLEDHTTLRFVISDNHQQITVHYRGALPDLFREGRGVVAQGRWMGEGLFIAQEVLAKHDENYMPPEAKYAVEQGAYRAAAQRVKPE
jgi:cytochrome c-type biogenesis protein CcmE